MESKHGQNLPHSRCAQPGWFGDNLFETSGFTTQRRDLVGIGLTDTTASQALLAGRHKVLGPCVIKTLGDAFSSAQLGDAVFAT